MAIEFRCTSCDRLLRVGDDAAGKRAKCPQCETVLTVPTAFAAEASSDAPAAPPPLPPPSDNPYAAPRAPNPYEAPRAAPMPFSPGTLELSSIFNRTWAIFKTQPGMCIAGFVVGWLVCVIVSVLLNKIAGRSALLQLVASVITMALSIWILMGLFRMMLKIARGQPAGLNEVFVTDPNLILPFLGASILVGILFVIGLFLLIIPGVIVLLMLSQTPFLIVDRNVGVMDALSQSSQITNGHKLELFLIGLVATIAAWLVTLLTCFLGGFVAFPFVILMTAVIYLTLTGQPTIA